MAQVVRVKNLKNDSFHKNSIHFFFFMKYGAEGYLL